MAQRASANCGVMSKASEMGREARLIVERQTGQPVENPINAMPEANTLWGPDVGAPEDPLKEGY